jgi:hypothetical protein
MNFTGPVHPMAYAPATTAPVTPPSLAQPTDDASRDTRAQPGCRRPIRVVTGSSNRNGSPDTGGDLRPSRIPPLSGGGRVPCGMPGWPAGTPPGVTARPLPGAWDGSGSMGLLCRQRPTGAARGGSEPRRGRAGCRSHWTGPGPAGDCGGCRVVPGLLLHEARSRRGRRPGRSPRSANVARPAGGWRPRPDGPGLLLPGAGAGLLECPGPAASALLQPGAGAPGLVSCRFAVVGVRCSSGVAQRCLTP